MRRPVPVLVACTLILLVAAIMVAIFRSFCLDRIPEMKQMGFGLAVAVLFDATLIRVTLVPAFIENHRELELVDPTPPGPAATRTPARMSSRTRFTT
jgi:uncharacterized membrane protein YdfJ with MMPL/SSD domain